MRQITSEDLAEPISQAYVQTRSYVREHPRWSIGAAVGIALLVALGLWGWPELRRTVHMHRM